MENFRFCFDYEIKRLTSPHSWNKLQLTLLF